MAEDVGPSLVWCPGVSGRDHAGWHGPRDHKGGHPLAAASASRGSHPSRPGQPGDADRGGILTRHLRPAATHNRVARRKLFARAGPPTTRVRQDTAPTGPTATTPASHATHAVPRVLVDHLSRPPSGRRSGRRGNVDAVVFLDPCPLASTQCRQPNRPLWWWPAACGCLRHSRVVGGPAGSSALTTAAVTTPGHSGPGQPCKETH